MKKAAAFVGMAIFSVYLIGFFLSAVYFNFTFAKENSFLKWLLFGQFVPTLKAAAWPYYAIQSRKAKNERALAMEHYSKSAEASKRVSELLSNGVARSEVFQPEQTQQLIGLISVAVSEAKQVDATLLAKFHAEMPGRYRSGFIEGLELLRAGLETKDVDQAARGLIAYQSFLDWMEKLPK